jgi:hypothetical protein
MFRKIYAIKSLHFEACVTCGLLIATIINRFPVQYDLIRNLLNEQTNDTRSENSQSQTNPFRDRMSIFMLNHNSDLGL